MPPANTAGSFGGQFHFSIQKANYRGGSERAPASPTRSQWPTHATFFGNATVDGAPTTYRIDVDDLSQPGAGGDSFKLQTGSGYTVGGVLVRGDIQIHG